MLALCSNLVRSKIEYAPVSPNPHTNTDSKKMEPVQSKFSAPYYNRFSRNHNSHRYSHVLGNLKSHNSLLNGVILYSYT